MKGDTEEAGQERYDEERRLEERFDLEKTAPVVDKSTVVALMGWREAGKG